MLSDPIASRILIVRGHKVLLDRVLAELYRVPVRSLNQAVRRNLDRFPEDFMLQLDWDEVESLRSQNVILNERPQRDTRRGAHAKYPPRAFTEQGVAMLSTVLRSKRAVRANIEIMRAFVRLREFVAQNRDLARRLNALEAKYDGQFKVVFDAIRELMAPSEAKPRRHIGFIAGD